MTEGEGRGGQSSQSIPDDSHSKLISFKSKASVKANRGRGIKKKVEDSEDSEQQTIPAEDFSKALQAIQNDPKFSSIVGRAEWSGVFGLSTQQLTNVFTYILGAKNLHLKDLDLLANNLSEIPSELLAGAVVRLEKCKLRFCSLRTDQLNGLVTYIRRAENLQLKDLDLSMNNLSEIPSGLLAGAVVRLQRCELRFCSLRTDQLNGLVTYIRRAENLQLKHLGLGWNILSEVPSDILADAVVRLEECYLDYCNLTTNQHNGLFTFIRKAKNLQLKHLGLAGNNLSEVPSDILAGAVVRLETVDFENQYLTKDQLCRIFTLIAQRKCGKLKEISLDEISGVSRDLFHSAGMNTDVEILYDHYDDEDGEVEESDSESEDRCRQQETASTEPFNKKLRSWRK